MVAKEDSLLHSVLTSLLPNTWLESSARASGVLRRQRKVSVPLFFWTLIFGFAVGSQRSISALRRMYELRAGCTLSHATFFARFNAQFVSWMQTVFDQTIKTLQARCPAPQARFLDGCREVLALDSSTFSLGQCLRTTLPSTSKDGAAIKLHSVINVLDGRTKTLKLSTGRASDVGRWTRIGSWVKGTLLLFDLGYFSYHLFSRIDNQGGYFLSRLKANSNPLIVGENLTWRGNTIKLIGQHWQDVKDKMSRELVDVQVEVAFSKEARRGQKSKGCKTFRLIGLKHPQTGQHHWYITNLTPQMMSAEDVRKVYALRWQVELFFRALKTHAKVRKLNSHNEWVVKTMLWAAMILTVINVALRYQAMQGLSAQQQARVPWLRWCEVVATFATEILDEICGIFRPSPLWDQLCRHALDPNIRRSNAFSFLPS